MKYYSIRDISNAYNIKADALKRLCRTRKIESLKAQQTKNTFMYVIPETELVKLEHLKLREPVPSKCAQPGYYEERLREMAEEQAERLRQYAERQAETQREREEHVNYYDYMQSNEWRQLRREALKRDGYICQRCGTGKNLQVHHVNYEHLGQAGELEDVITLCKTCHEHVHKQDLVNKHLSIYEED